MHVALLAYDGEWHGPRLRGRAYTRAALTRRTCSRKREHAIRQKNNKTHDCSAEVGSRLGLHPLGLCLKWFVGSWVVPRKLVSFLGQVIGDAANSILQDHGPEVDQQTQLLVGQPKVRQKLLLVDR